MPFFTPKKEGNGPCVHTKPKPCKLVESKILMMNIDSQGLSQLKTGSLNSLDPYPNQYWPKTERLALNYFYVNNCSNTIQ